MEVVKHQRQKKADESSKSVFWWEEKGKKAEGQKGACGCLEKKKNRS